MIFLSTVHMSFVNLPGAVEDAEKVTINNSVSHSISENIRPHLGKTADEEGTD